MLNVFPGVTSFDYTYDANKNKTSETIGGVMAGYGFAVPSGGYDAQDRLTAWERADSNLNLSWALSNVGNWLTNSTNGVPESRTHTDVHEIASIASNPVTHDPKGNTTSNPYRGGQSYTWDFDNHLVDATTTSDTLTFTYDALGRRVSKSDGTTTTIYVCAGHQIVAEYTPGALPASPQRVFVYGVYIDEPLVMVAGASRHYYHRNHLYSVAALTDSTGAVIERYAYTAYGIPTILEADGIAPRATSLVDNPYLFTGRQWEPELGIYYYRARYYDPEPGRFLGRDRLGYVDGLSLYQYLNSSPHGYTDPSGLRKFSITLTPASGLQLRSNALNNPKFSRTGHNTLTGGGVWEDEGVWRTAALQRVSATIHSRYNRLHPDRLWLLRESRRAELLESKEGIEVTAEGSLVTYRGNWRAVSGGDPIIPRYGAGIRFTKRNYLEKIDKVSSKGSLIVDCNDNGMVTIGLKDRKAWTTTARGKYGEIDLDYVDFARDGRSATFKVQVKIQSTLEANSDWNISSTVGFEKYGLSTSVTGGYSKGQSHGDIAATLTQHYDVMCEPCPTE